MQTKQLTDALTLVRRANLRGWLLCRRTPALLELEWRGQIQWVSGRGTGPGGYWAQALPLKGTVRKCSSVGAH
jgi:hypothetical protein